MQKNLKSKLKILVTAVLTILVLSGCVNLGEQTTETIQPKTQIQPPLLMNTIITDSNWNYTYQGKTYTKSGTWFHLPKSDAANLLLYIKQNQQL